MSTVLRAGKGILQGISLGKNVWNRLSNSSKSYGKPSHNTSKNTFPKNPEDLLPGLPRDEKGYIYPADNLRIRPEKHPLKPGEIFNPQHHGQHYHIELGKNIYSG